MEILSINVTVTDGIATLPNGDVVDLKVHQALLNELFQETGSLDYMRAADSLAKVTGLVQGPQGKWLHAADEVTESSSGRPARVCTMPQRKYAIGKWIHSAAIGGEAIDCRVAIDLQSHAVLSAEELVDQRYKQLSGERLEEVASVVAGAFLRDPNPEAWGFVQRGHLPYWAWNALGDPEARARHLGNATAFTPIVELFAPFEVVLADTGDGTPAKIGLVIDEMEITEPGLSECGRFEVDPFEAYRLEAHQVNALKRLNVLLVEAVHVSLDAGCLRVQEQLGIATGDLAGLHFASGEALSQATRVLGDYVVEEINAGAAICCAKGARPSPP